jgi:frataxin-like iron-binding protein CyaY
MASLTEQDFRLEADRALEQEGFEVDLQNGVLQVVFDEPTAAKFVVSPNAPVRQVWVSALTRSFKLSWESEASAFALDGETLDTMLGRLAREHLTGQTG